MDCYKPNLQKREPAKIQMLLGDSSSQMGPWEGGGRAESRRVGASGPASLWAAWGPVCLHVIHLPPHLINIRLDPLHHSSLCVWLSPMTPPPHPHVWHQEHASVSDAHLSTSVHSYHRKCRPAERHSEEGSAQGVSETGRDIYSPSVFNLVSFTPE